MSGPRSQLPQVGVIKALDRVPSFRSVPGVPPPTPSRSLPIALDDAYTLWLWLDARVMDFPTGARRTHGDAILVDVLALLDALLRAHHGRGDERRRWLDEANARIARLRLLVRGARELRRISPEQHAFAAERLDHVGRQVGAWRRATAERP